MGAGGTAGHGLQARRHPAYRPPVYYGRSYYGGSYYGYYGKYADRSRGYSSGAYGPSPYSSEGP